jgi:hypothetical protein
MRFSQSQGSAPTPSTPGTLTAAIGTKVLCANAPIASDAKKHPSTQRRVAHRTEGRCQTEVCVGRWRLGVSRAIVSDAAHRAVISSV